MSNRQTAVSVAEPGDAPRGTARERWGWYTYDWANSAFASTVVTLFLGPYLTSVAKRAAGADGMIHPFGIALQPGALWGFLVALSVMTQVVVLPVVGAIADASSRKRLLLGGLAYVGAVATMAMYLVQGEAYLFGAFLFLTANLTFGASIVVYNSFLPDIASADERDNVSSRGWGIGYLGGGIVLALNLLLYQNAAKWGIGEDLAARISLFSAGAWWALFTLAPMFLLQDRPPLHKRHESGGPGLLRGGFLQLFETLRELRKYPQTLLFLVAYLVYNDAIQAVIALAAQFGQEELGIPLATLTMAILMVQFVAFVGALAFNFVANRIGAKRAVMVSLVIWTGVLVAMYGVVRDTRGFFIAAAVVAIVMGGSQALSRSLFSLMIPKGREAEYFSLYEISDKGTSWLAPLVFAVAFNMTRSYRLAILSLIVFFAAGLVLLTRVNVRRAAIEAGNEPPAH